jgi:uncharacterized protein YwgA
VENPARRLTTRETVLLITDAADGSVEGRTVMQKLAYFSGLGLGLGTRLGHRPHFYGPYSSKVEDALSLASVAGDLQETVERMPDWSGTGPDVAKYSYALTDQGRAKAQSLRAEHPDEWKRIATAVSAIREVVPDLNQKTLSSAAKTYLILSETEDDVSEEQIPDLAGRLGWKLTAAEVRRTVDVLKQLGLVTIEGDQPTPPAQASAAA